ncbi:hypothetical protein [Paraburkholderia acidiphila]|uniref:Uncharacterized protein n=1 Tax=Paraburkholderia acidiphila TaxID=2571747 RepID=A0A7Z2J9T9_9BURK|nr:hypothetical protein [Paraburkholderia acidiphila]QGZ56721.1 hypothetical protein FAZ97_17300 [Paraburkholderia acidiphila]
MKLLTTFLLTAAEIGLGWFWLAAGHNVAGRFLTFYWWLIVAVTFGFALFLVIIRLVTDRAIPIPGTTRTDRIVSRVILFARVIAQVAIGCTSLAVFSLAGWLFAKFALLLATEEKKAAGA